MEKAALIFNLHGFDQNKSISRHELTVLMTNSLTALSVMAKEPAPSSADIESKAKAVFRNAHLDGNDRITLNEFMRFLRQDNEMSQCLLRYGIARPEELGGHQA